ncbi:hypothetical protein [Rhizobium sp. CC-YZS058]|uniref:hypothetical protein n=1 Tax=Rhizobium sp. CC-YZS058 TaxID=3042153 RepID=UPI002B053695|nr:hypothetical protein [Rhizobium sp. CC-YZS058]MEA3535635.1 hypothetical protein [Rhizobium sp. CC-YZS058]
MMQLLPTWNEVAPRKRHRAKGRDAARLAMLGLFILAPLSAIALSSLPDPTRRQHAAEAETAEAKAAEARSSEAHTAEAAPETLVALADPASPPAEAGGDDTALPDTPNSESPAAQTPAAQAAPSPAEATAAEEDLPGDTAAPTPGPAAKPAAGTAVPAKPEGSADQSETAARTAPATAPSPRATPGEDLSPTAARAIEPNTRPADTAQAPLADEGARQLALADPQAEAGLAAGGAPRPAPSAQAANEAARLPDLVAPPLPEVVPVPRPRPVLRRVARGDDAVPDMRVWRPAGEEDYAPAPRSSARAAHRAADAYGRPPAPGAPLVDAYADPPEAYPPLPPEAYAPLPPEAYARRRPVRELPPVPIPPRGVPYEDEVIVEGPVSPPGSRILDLATSPFRQATRLLAPQPREVDEWGSDRRYVEEQPGW